MAILNSQRSAAMMLAGSLGKKDGEMIAVVGPVASGKTEAIILEVAKTKNYGSGRALIFKPKDDEKNDVVETWIGESYPAMPIDNNITDEVKNFVKRVAKEATLVAFDDVQKFNGDFVKLLVELRDMGKKVYAVGVDLTSDEEPYGIMPDIIAQSNIVIKKKAFCRVCGGEANTSIVDKKGKGYVPVCAHHRNLDEGRRKGKIVVYTGPMCSGKSNNLISDISLKVSYGRRKCIVFYPDRDTRAEVGMVESRTGKKLNAEMIKTFIDDKVYNKILKLAEGKDVVAFDETNFFQGDITKVVRDLRDLGKEVYVSGLELDYYGNTFGHMGEIECFADEIKKLTACCYCCGEDKAHYTQKLEEGLPVTGGEQICVGSESYVAACNAHFCSPMEAKSCMQLDFLKKMYGLTKKLDMEDAISKVDEVVLNDEKGNKSTNDADLTCEA